MRTERRLRKLDKSYSEHLREARKRIFSCVLFLGFAFSLCILNASPIFEAVLKPGTEAGFEIISVSPGDALVAGITVVFLSSFFLTVPFMTIQFGSFMMPAVDQAKRVKLRVVIFVIIVLFFAGLAFSFKVMLPVFFGFMHGYGGQFMIAETFSVMDYVSFIITFSVVMGIAFETPLFVVAMWIFGIMDRQKVKKFRGVFYLVIFVGAAFITPPDVISQVMVALPMLGLFELGNVCGMSIQKRNKGINAQGKDEFKKQAYVREERS